MASLRDQLVGAWELVEYRAYLCVSSLAKLILTLTFIVSHCRPKDRSDTIYPMGRDAEGIIMYTPDGFMSAQLQTPGVAKFEPPGTDKNWAEVGRCYIAYTGRFFLDEKGDSHGPLLVHEMRNSNLPRLTGDRQRRLCDIKDESDGRYLYLSTADPIKFGEEYRTPLVRWKRLEMNMKTREPDSE